MGFSRNFKFLIGVSGSLTSVEFGKIPRLVKSGKILRHRVDIGGNLRLINLSKFFKF